MDSINRMEWGGAGADERDTIGLARPRRPTVALRRGLSAWLRGYDGLLFAAYVLFLMPLFLSNSSALPHTLFLLLAIPAFAVCAASLMVRWTLRPEAQALDFSVRGTGSVSLTVSVVFVALVVYLLAMILASAVNLNGADTRHVERMLTGAVEIVLFTLMTAYLLVRNPRFTVLAFSVISTIAALAALVNVIAFAGQSADLMDTRLTAVLGMPAYVNSTNISATYAIFLIGTVAVIVSRASPRLLRLALVPVAATLLVALLMTQARSALIAVLVGAAILAWTSSPWARRALIVALAAICLTIVASPDARERLVDRGGSYRPELWATYLSMATERPILGRGTLVPVTVTMRDGIVIDQPHNIVLSAQIRGGIGAAAAMLVILLGGLYWSARYWRHAGDATPLALIATMGSFGMFDYTILITPAAWPWVTFWLPIALCIGAELAVKRAALAPAAASA